MFDADLVYKWQVVVIIRGCFGVLFLYQTFFSFSYRRHKTIAVVTISVGWHSQTKDGLAGSFLHHERRLNLDSFYLLLEKASHVRVWSGISQVVFWANRLGHACSWAPLRAFKTLHILIINEPPLFIHSTRTIDDQF